MNVRGTQMLMFMQLYIPYKFCIIALRVYMLVLYLSLTVQDSCIFCENACCSLLFIPRKL